MQDILTETVNKFKNLCDYMEIRIEDYETTKIAINTDETEKIGTSFEFGGNVRALVNGGWGFISFNNINLLPTFAARAIDHAKHVGRNKLVLSPVPSIVDRVKAELLSDPRNITLKEKKKLLDDYNKIILNYDRELIKNSFLAYYDQIKKKYFCNSEGTFIEQELLDLYITVKIIAAKDGITQPAVVTNGSSNNFDVCRNLEEKIEKSCRTAIKFLDAPKVKSGVYTVICDPAVTGTFAHEAFGHTCEADHFYKSESLKKEMRLGRVFGSTVLSIYDTGLDIGSRGSMKYDDEGVKTEKTYLIKEGVLSGRLHSRETASILGENPTGSARAIDYRFPPICRMRNTCIEGGTSTFDDMIKDIKLGIYAIDFLYGMGGEMFTVAPAYSYMIRNGHISEAVRDVKITGNLFETLKNIDMTGNDFKINDSGGGCGRGEQWPLATTESGPHIRIQNVSIGGES